MEFYNNKDEKIDLVDFYYLNHRSLLVNGDFQINQRGDKEYTTDGKFTLDMWLLKQGLSIKPIANGITVSKRSGASTFMFMQNVPHQMENEKNYTFSIKCGGQIYSKTFVYDNTNQTSSLNAPFVFENSNIGVKVFNFNGNDSIQIYLKVNTLNFEYIDLFEGDIAYPHVKKSYQDDLWDCMGYLQILSANAMNLSLYKMWGIGKSTSLVSVTPLARPMVSRPVIKDNGDLWMYSNDTSTEYRDITRYSMEYHSNGIIKIVFYNKNDSKFTENNFAFTFGKPIEISCE